MNLTLITHCVYLALGVVLTIWVARTLHRHGRVFLIDSFHGKTELADSVNHLLVVGFYLVNIGYVTLALRYGLKPVSAVDAMEVVSTKIGLVLVVLGGMHFMNMYVFNRLRRRAIERSVSEEKGAVA